MTWLSHAWPQVLELTWQHLLLSAPAIILSIIFAVPLGWFASRFPGPGGILLSGATLLYAIPGLPMLILIPVLFSTPLRSDSTMIIALTIYGVALLVRTAADAFKAIDHDVRRAAVSLGYSTRSMFWQVDLPLAIPVLVSGIRVVTVSTVGLVTIGALIGVSSLGTLFTDGFQRGIMAEVVTGIVATVALALALDQICSLIGRFFTPWIRAEKTGQPLGRNGVDA